MSRATSYVNRAELLDLTAAAAANNRRAGVTGALLFCGGYFLQILEGDPAVLDGLFKKIGQDARHSDVQPILRVEGADRLFPDWTMSCLHEAAMTHDQFERATRWTRLVNLPDMGRTVGREAQSLIAEMRAAIATESREVSQRAA